MSAPIGIGDIVRIKRGVCGEGYAFRVAEFSTAGHGEATVYGHNYGPVRLSEVERLHATPQPRP